MKILCLHRELLQPGGSETFFKAITDELVRLDHEVFIYTLKKGTYAGYFHKDCQFVDLQSPAIPPVFDFVVSMHRPMAEYVKRLNCFKTMICNGIIPIELAVPGFDRYISVSNEVQLANKKLGFESDVLYNSVNLNLFQPLNSVNEKLTFVLMISNHFPGVVRTVADACTGAGLFFKHIGFTHWTGFVERDINNSDLVVSLGRGVYESMACGRNVIVYDYRGGDGFLTPDNYSTFLTRNCSGRTCKFQYRPDQLHNLFNLYDPKLGPKLRHLAACYHDIKFFVSELLKPVSGKVEINDPILSFEDHFTLCPECSSSFPCEHSSPPVAPSSTKKTKAKTTKTTKKPVKKKE